MYAGIWTFKDSKIVVDENSKPNYVAITLLILVVAVILAATIIFTINCCCKKPKVMKDDSTSSDVDQFKKMKVEELGMVKSENGEKGEDLNY
jgi:hypothetical protein